MAKKATKATEKNEAVNDRKKALETAIAQIRKANGEESIVRLGEQKKSKVSVVSTGSLNLDLALGVGGLPKGRIIEIYGLERKVFYHIVVNQKILFIIIYNHRYMMISIIIL